MSLIYLIVFPDRIRPWTSDLGWGRHRPLGWDRHGFCASQTESKILSQNLYPYITFQLKPQQNCVLCLSYTRLGSLCLCFWKSLQSYMRSRVLHGSGNLIKTQKILLEINPKPCPNQIHFNANSEIFKIRIRSKRKLIHNLI